MKSRPRWRISDRRGKKGGRPLERSDTKATQPVFESQKEAFFTGTKTQKGALEPVWLFMLFFQSHCAAFVLRSDSKSAVINAAGNIIFQTRV